MEAVLKYPGAKNRLAEWIISFIPEHRVYLELFFGSGAVFFNKDPAKIETLNDLDGEVYNLFKVIRDRPEEFAKSLEMTPYSREEYENAYKKFQLKQSWNGQESLWCVVGWVWVAATYIKTGSVQANKAIVPKQQNTGENCRTGSYWRRSG